MVTINTSFSVIYEDLWNQQKSIILVMHAQNAYSFMKLASPVTSQTVYNGLANDHSVIVVLFTVACGNHKNVFLKCI